MISAISRYMGVRIEHILETRSALAASLLARAGAEQVIHVADGGVGTWREQGWPIEHPERSATTR
jgi:hypothetical protein